MAAKTPETLTIKRDVLREDLLQAVAEAEYRVVVAERAGNLLERERQSGRASAIRWVAEKFNIEADFAEMRSRYEQIERDNQPEGHTEPEETCSLCSDEEGGR